MSRLAEKLQSSLFFTCTATRFISRLILSTFRLCNSRFTKTLTLTALLSPPSARLMDHDDNGNINNSSSNLFSNDDDDHLLDFDLNPSSSLQNYFYSFSPSGFIIYPAFREEDDRLKLYLVPYRYSSLYIFSFFILFGFRENGGIILFLCWGKKNCVLLWFWVSWRGGSEFLNGVVNVGCDGVVLATMMETRRKRKENDMSLFMGSGVCVAFSGGGRRHNNLLLIKKEEVVLCIEFHLTVTLITSRLCSSWRS